MKISSKSRVGALLVLGLVSLVYLSHIVPGQASTRLQEDDQLGVRSIGVQVSAFGDAQLRPDRTTIRAFVPTSSLSDHCLVTLSESNFPVPGATIFCAPRMFQGQQGILVSVFLPQPMRAGFFLSASIYQEWHTDTEHLCSTLERSQEYWHRRS